MHIIELVYEMKQEWYLNFCNRIRYMHEYQDVRIEKKIYTIIENKTDFQFIVWTLLCLYDPVVKSCSIRFLHKTHLISDPVANRVILSF